MQYEFTGDSNRIFVRARLGLNLIALAAVLQLGFFLLFHGIQVQNIAIFSDALKISNIIYFVALIMLLGQSIAASKSLLRIVATAGSDLTHLFSALRFLFKSLICVAVLFLINAFSSFVNHTELLACIKAS